MSGGAVHTSRGMVLTELGLLESLRTALRLPWFPKPRRFLFDVGGLRCVMPEKRGRTGWCRQRSSNHEPARE